MLTAGTAEAFAEQAVELLRNPELRSSLGANARQMIQEQYDWNVIGQTLEEIYQRGR